MKTHTYKINIIKVYFTVSLIYSKDRLKIADRGIVAFLPTN